MHKKPLLAAVVACSLACFSTASPLAFAANPDNIFPAGEFEKTGPDNAPKGWKFPLGYDNGSELVSDGDVRWLRLEAGKSAEAVLKLDPEWKKLDLSVRLKAEFYKPGEDGSKAIRLLVRFESSDDGSAVGAVPECPTLNQNTDWKAFSLSLKVPAGADRLRITATHGGKAGAMGVRDLIIIPAGGGGAEAKGDKAEPEVKAAKPEKTERVAKADEAEKPAEKAAEKAAEKPTEKSAEKPEKPATKAAEKPAAHAGKPPALAPIGEPPEPRLPKQGLPDEKVEAAIRKGVDFLFKKQNSDGTWETGKSFLENRDFTGAETSAVLYALLHAGASIDDPRLKPSSAELAPAVKYLLGITPKTTYTAGLHANALALAAPRPGERSAERVEFEKAMARIGEYLMVTATADGGYTYNGSTDPKKKTTAWDNSCTQYGVLGMWALEEAGAEIPEAFWKTLDGHWRKYQQTDGGWCYAKEATKERGSTLAMTSAGVASLFVSSEFAAPNQLVTETKGDKNISDGIAWLNKNFKPDSNLYTLYGCERVGLASGLRNFGSHDWFQEAAPGVVKTQAPDGALGNNGLGGSQVISTAYSLLFLARGRNPVAFNKLQYGDTADGKPTRWNARPRDDANLTAQISKVYEKGLNWQVVNLNLPAEEMVDAPVMLITGSRDPKFTPMELAKLRAFVHYGGMIFSSSDGASDEFTNAMRKYAATIAGGEFVFRDLPKDHAAFTMVAKTGFQRMQGLSNGVREWWIHSPGDLGAVWQRKDWKTRPDAFQIPANLYFYALGKSVTKKHKPDSVLVYVPESKPARTIRMARVKYDGPWNVEPGAWARASRLARRDYNTDLQLLPTPLAELDPKITPLAHISGPAGFKLSDSDIAALKKYLAGGGTLFADAAGGKVEFVNAFRDLVSTLYPGVPLDSLPTDHVVYNGSVKDSVTIKKVEYRRFVALNRGASNEPKLLGVKVDGRYPIIFSPDDITSGLLGTDTWGILGYTAEYSQNLTRNIVLAYGQGK